MRPICKFKDCGRASWVRGYCPRHYYNLLHSGQLRQKVVRKRKTLEELFHEGYVVDPDTGCWEWVAWFHKKGYAYMQTHEQKKVKASRFAYEQYVGALSDTEMVLHTCDFRKCVNPAHLFKGDAGINNRDCVAKGRHWTVTAERMKKITKPMAANIRIMFARGEYSMQKLADIYRVDQQTISNIVHGRAHLRLG